jgi:PAS domain S-box-containing protein
MNTRSDAACSDDTPETSETQNQSLLDTERQIAHLRTLQEICHRLTSKLELEDVLTGILDEAIGAVGAERGCLFIVDTVTGKLELRLSRGLQSSDVKSKSFQISQTVIERVWRDGTPLISANALKDPTLSKVDSVVKHTLRSILCVPLHQRGQRIGVLYLDNRLKVGQFRDDDLALAVAIADQAAVALQNAQLYQAAQQELSERKQAVKALQESQQLLERTLSSLREALFIIDADSVEIKDCNPAALEMFGYRRQQVLGQTANFLHVDEAALAEFRRQLFAAIEEEGFLHQLEFRMKRKDGTVFPTEHSVLPLEDEQGKRFGWVSVVRDMTEQKRAEERLHLLSAAIEQSSEGIAMSDLEGNLIFVNDAFAAMHGYVPQDLLGKHLSVFHTPEQMASVEAANHQIQETGEFSGEIWHAQRDGTVFPTLMHNSLLRDEAGKSIGMIGTTRDITERVQAEKALRRRNRELALLNQTSKLFNSTLDLNQVFALVLEEVRHLLKVTACSVWLIDSETEKLVCRQAAGPGSQILRGCSLELGQGFAGLVVSSGESLCVPDAPTDERFWDGVAVKTGLDLHSILCVPLRTKRGVIGVIYVVDREIDRFGSEDLRLVEALTGAAAIAIENAQLYARIRRLAVEQERHRLARELHDTVTQSLYSIGMAAQTSLKLLGRTDVDSRTLEPIDHILTLSQGALTEMREQLHDLHPTILSEKGLTQAIAEYCHVLRTQYLLSIALVADPEPPLSMAQRETLYFVAREALSNVVKNASAEHVDVSLTTEDDQIELSVVDDGAGFDPSIVSAKQTMGLRSMQERTGQVAGAFELESRPGRGTRVTVRIPVRSPENTKASPS